VCDVDGNGTITAADGLPVVRKAVGLSSELACPAVTTTTLDGGSTTNTVR
jgi:hypothetical protein